MTRALYMIAVLAATACSDAQGPARLCEDTGTTCRLSRGWQEWVAAEPHSRRDLLRYAVKCALPKGTSVETPWEVLPGGAGLQPEWRDSALELEGQERVSACLLASLNAFGEHVQIGLAGPDVSPGLKPTMRHLEAVYFGNVFAREPQLFACAGPSNSSPDAAKRVCGTHDGRCGITVVGACGTAGEGACSRWAGTPPHVYCEVARDARGTLHDHPITVYLRD